MDAKEFRKRLHLTHEVEENTIFILIKYSLLFYRIHLIIPLYLRFSNCQSAYACIVKPL